MKKCLLLVRVSTQQQSFAEQKEDLIRAAQRDGYKKVGEDIFIVDGVESAIHLKESERETIIEMKKAIESDSDIRALYIWELSRLSRRLGDLCSVRDYLQNKKVQLVCLKPELRLFNEVDWTANEFTSLLFGIFGTMAESEMMVKKARFRRTKIEHARNGLFNGGTPKWGYRVDENNKYVIDEEQANIIRKIFSMHVDEKMSMHQIHDELAKLGIQKSFTSIRYVLRDESYTGRMAVWRKNQHERIFPMIIPHEVWEEAQVVSKNNRISTKVTQSNWSFLATKILKCWQCGHNMSPKPKNCLYYCVTHTYPYTSETITCDNKCTVRADVLDSLLWQLTRDTYIKVLMAESKDQLTALEEQKLTLKSKISVAQEELSKESVKNERNHNLWILGEITSSSYESNKKNIAAKRNSLQNDISEWTNTLNSVLQQINVLEKRTKMSIEEIEELIQSVIGISDSNEKKKLVNRFIKCVYVKYLKPGCKDKVIEIIYQNGLHEFYLHKAFKTVIHRIVLLNDEKYAIIDNEVGFEFEYEEVHLTQKHYVEQLKKRASNK